MIDIVPIPAFTDNYIWLMHDGTNALVVDPGDATPVLNYLQDHHLTLTTILITHHHQDHTGGVHTLSQHTDCKIYAPTNTPLPCCNHRVSADETFTITDLNLDFTVLNLAGHTLDHVGYYTPGSLFCGDTLFRGGCGRIFEGTATMMYAALERIAALPDATLIYCAHEYTLANYHFATAVEPDNLTLQQQLQAVMALRQQNKPSLPSTLALEKMTNPFLRCHKPAIRQAVTAYCQQDCLTPTTVLHNLRKWKDEF